MTTLIVLDSCIRLKLFITYVRTPNKYRRMSGPSANSHGSYKLETKQISPSNVAASTQSISPCSPRAEKSAVIWTNPKNSKNNHRRHSLRARVMEQLKLGSKTGLLEEKSAEFGSPPTSQEFGNPKSEPESLRHRSPVTLPSDMDRLVHTNFV